MKRLIFTTCLLAALSGYTQSDSTNVKVNGGEKTLEVQLSPFGDDPININGIRARWFSTDKKAFRLNAFLGYDSDTQVTQQGSGNGNDDLKDRATTFTFSVRPGFENHILVTERLSPYFGMEFDFTFQTTSFRSEQQTGGVQVNYTKRVNENGFVRIGANAVAGMDFYVAKKLYIGTEFGFGFSYTGLLAVKVKSDVAGFEEPDPLKRGSSFDLGPNVVAEIRLGYAF